MTKGIIVCSEHWQSGGAAQLLLLCSMTNLQRLLSLQYIFSRRLPSTNYYSSYGTLLVIHCFRFTLIAIL
ncbi:hypothetical protein EYC80_008988 [Monilinia laxa]|uniref:Uncharacterized protein n=1 Tax=Monilinia laxa TaxID=61186 RepID=A0A5N6K249_MONLA|nr:hypothetical protein EYC80_008988 [Monilinia laxa]